jgi:uncharacterized protein YciI
MHFFCKLNAPRATFVQDMTSAEHQLMQEHAGYWRDWMDRGHVIVFGLAADPGGAYGVGIVDFPTAEEARAFADSDPTVRAGIGFTLEVHPMPLGAVIRNAE